MADWPGSLQALYGLSTIDVASGGAAADIYVTRITANATNTWPSANLAIYIPVLVQSTMTAYQIVFVVGTQSGNCDVGIYDELGNRIVSKGSTAVAASGFQG